MTDFFHVKSVSEVNELFGIKPIHPLITVIRKWPKGDFDISSFKVTSDLYLLFMKGKTKGTSFKYGKNSYDFKDGPLFFWLPIKSFRLKIQLKNWTILGGIFYFILI